VTTPHLEDKPPKQGADDFIAAGHREADLQELPRREFATDPEVERLGDDFTLTWPADRVTLAAVSLREHHGELTTLLTVARDGQDCHWGRLNLTATRSREELVKKLTQESPGLPWRRFLDRAAQLITEQFTATDPTVELIPQLGERDRYLLEPFLIEDAVSVLFADGGSGKGFVSLAFAASIRAAVGLPGGVGAAKKTGVLYLDWETSQRPLERRVYLLGRGFGTSITGIQYRRMTRSLVDDMPAIRADAARHGIGLVIVDSWAPACGEGPEGSDASTRSLNALRSLTSVSKLILAHVSKAMADTRTATRPYGSVFNQNLPRSVWEMRGVQEEDSLTVTLYDRKENDAARRKPITWRFDFSEERIRLGPGDMAEHADLLAGAKLPEQLGALLNLTGRTPEELADLIGEPTPKLDSVRKALRRLETKGRAKKIGDLWCRA
jgi:hypothetical protein